jgi:hypothetical protein
VSLAIALTLLAIGSVLWLTTLLLTGFSTVAVSLGLLAFVFVIGERA